MRCDLTKLQPTCYKFNTKHLQQKDDDVSIKKFCPMPRQTLVRQNPNMHMEAPKAKNETKPDRIEVDLGGYNSCVLVRMASSPAPSR